jgi:hypothetical protein
MLTINFNFRSWLCATEPRDVCFSKFLIERVVFLFLSKKREKLKTKGAEWRVASGNRKCPGQN